MVGEEELYISIKGVLYKRCKDCKKFFLCNSENFYANSKSKDGKTVYCKKCHKVRIAITRTEKAKQNKRDRLQNKTVFSTVYGFCYYLKGVEI